MVSSPWGFLWFWHSKIFGRTLGNDQGQIRVNPYKLPELAFP